MKTELKALAILFLKLGFIGFGGPAAHIAMMYQEVVTKKKWMTEQHFLDLLGATNLIPGPNSTEMAIHIGQERAGWRGLILAGVCFITPAVLITACVAFLYKQYGTLPQVQPFIYGIKPAIIAVIISSIYPLTKIAMKSFFLILLGTVVLVLSLLGWNEIYLLFGSGLMALLWNSNKGKKEGKLRYLPWLFLLDTAHPFLSAKNVKLFFVFLKIGAILYGSGYMLFAFLDTELVAKGLITRLQLMDAIAVGQFTPGPVFSAVTFIGYQMDGISGAAISTIAVFLPSFIFVAALHSLLAYVKGSRPFAAFLDAVNVASVSIVFAVCIAMGRETINDWRTMLIAAVSIAIAMRYRKVNTVWIIGGGALGGYLLTLL